MGYEVTNRYGKNLIQHVVGIDLTGGVDGEYVDRIAIGKIGSGVRRAGRQRPTPASKIRRKVSGRGGIGGRLFILQRPLLFGSVNLAEIVNAGVLLSLCAGTYEVRDGDGGQKTDDGHDDHDFD